MLPFHPLAWMKQMTSCTRKELLSTKGEGGATLAASSAAQTHGRAASSTGKWRHPQDPQEEHSYPQNPAPLGCWTKNPSPFCKVLPLVWRTLWNKTLRSSAITHPSLHEDASKKGLDKSFSWRITALQQLPHPYQFWFYNWLLQQHSHLQISETRSLKLLARLFFLLKTAPR